MKSAIRTSKTTVKVRKNHLKVTTRTLLVNVSTIESLCLPGGYLSNSSGVVATAGEPMFGLLEEDTGGVAGDWEPYAGAEFELEIEGCEGGMDEVRGGAGGRPPLPGEAATGGPGAGVRGCAETGLGVGAVAGGREGGVGLGRSSTLGAAAVGRDGGGAAAGCALNEFENKTINTSQTGSELAPPPKQR